MSTSSAHNIEARNTRAFILFRIFFNCRLYYPILSILFLDFGLTLEQYSLLNVVWAVSIVLFEVPSGALADVIGRKRLVVFAAFLMILEMAILLFVPRMSGLVFAFCVVNRILSGLAEACASGADEAMTFDAIEEEGREKKWNALLARLMRLQSVVMTVTMIVGAFLYDWTTLTQLAPGLANLISRDVGLRLPIALNFLMAIACFLSALSFVDDSTTKMSLKSLKDSVLGSFKQIGSVARFIASKQVIFSLILLAMVLDSSLRMFMTLSSNFFRSLSIPESFYGIISSCVALVGYFSSLAGERLVERFGKKVNFLLLILLTLLAFVGMLFVKSPIALVYFFFIAFTMYLMMYFLSYYLNSEASADKRATLLSFKGLATNLSYGWIGLLYAASAAKNNASFESTLPFFWKYFVLMLLAAAILRYVGLRFLARRHGDR
jgi:MFS family permease